MKYIKNGYNCVDFPSDHIAKTCAPLLILKKK